jgi:hypothetical protein
MGYDEKARDFWTSTGVGTSAGVTVTKAAVAGESHVATSIDASGDTACIVTIESPASTVLWRKRFAAAFTTTANFEAGTIKGAFGDALLVKISASTSNCEANISGITV